MGKWLVLLCSLMMMGCVATSSPDGFPVLKSDMGGHPLSCKGTRCCWPWDNDGKLVICVEPTEGNYLGAGGVMITVRGKMP